MRSGWTPTQIGVLTVLAFLWVNPGCSSRPSPSPEADPVAEILKRYMVVDPAVTTRFFRFPEEPVTPFDPSALVKAGFDVAGLGVGTITEPVVVRDFSPYLYTSPEPGEPLALSVFSGAEAIKRFLWEIDAAHEAVSKNSDQVGLARSAGDLERLRSEGRLALLLGVDSGAVIEDLATLLIYHRLGLRRLQLAHGFAAPWADSCSAILDDEDLGLEEFGIEVVRECNRLGILVDLSHASDQTFWDTIEASSKPVIASHSGARSVVDAVRNLTDDMLRALAKNGGMIGVGAYYDSELMEPIRATGAWTATTQIHNYLLEKYTDPFQLAAALRSQRVNLETRKVLGLDPPSSLLKIEPRSGIMASVSNVEGTLEHLDYIVGVIGIDHLGIGTDIDMRREDYIWDLPAAGQWAAAAGVHGGADREDPGGQLLARLPGQRRLGDHSYPAWRPLTPRS